HLSEDRGKNISVVEDRRAMSNSRTTDEAGIILATIIPSGSKVASRLPMNLIWFKAKHSGELSVAKAFPLRLDETLNMEKAVHLIFITGTNFRLILPKFELFKSRRLKPEVAVLVRILRKIQFGRTLQIGEREAPILSTLSAL